MNKDRQAHNEVLSQIDSIITMLERSGSNNGFGDLLSQNEISVNISPLGFLLSILERCGTGKDKLINWLSEVIVGITPMLELAVKGVLLSNLKTNIDCNVDPRIPQNLREQVGGIVMSPWSNLEASGNTTDIESQQERGIEIDISSIDYYGMLNESPMSDRSHYKYFGTKKYYQAPEVFGDKKFYTYKQIVRACLEKEGDINGIKIQKTSEIDSVYELARAADMNAFLWFLIHKARFINTNNISELNNGNACILKTITGTTSTNSLLGRNYMQSSDNYNYSVIGLCIKEEPQCEQKSSKQYTSTQHSGRVVTDSQVAEKLVENTKTITGYNYTIVPTTNIWNGLNWYVNRKRYGESFKTWGEYNKKGNTWLKERNYDDEFALCRFSMIHKDDLLTNNILFTIKPSPNIITPELGFTVSKKQKDVQTTKNQQTKDKENKNSFGLEINYEGSTPWSFRQLLFNADGKEDIMGKYSVVIGDKLPREDGDGEYIKYNILNPYTNQTTNVYLEFNILTTKYKLDLNTGSNNREFIKSVLYECYPGMTVYEFNYDFVMGIQLFDPTVITAQLIEGLSNIRIGANYKSSVSENRDRISNVIKNIINNNGYKSTDCFYTFSNDEYNSMLEKSELKRSQLYSFNDGTSTAYKTTEEDASIYEILNEYNSNATKQENVSVIQRTLNEVSVTISKNQGGGVNTETNFIMEGINMLISILVESLLTPKLLLVLAINDKIMGKNWVELTENNKVEVNFEKNVLLDQYKYLLKMLENIVIGMVNEIVEIILKKLMDFAKEEIKELLSKATQYLVLEQVDYYTRLMKSLVSSCTFKFSGNPLLTSTIDSVEYADIDKNDIPVTNEC